MIFLTFWLLWVFVPSERILGRDGVLVCLAIGIILAFTLPTIRCPACKKNAENFHGRFCPECGAILIKDGGFLGFGFAKCQDCGKRVPGFSRHRNYKVRFCSNCGVHLDSEGI